MKKSFNKLLVGKPGNKEVEVNALGRIIREISNNPSTTGKEIQLTIDARLQKFSFSKLSDKRAGAIVVMEINTGNILSMASTPNFDSNLITKKPNKDYWQSLLENPLSPLTDRSIQGLYSPGSTFKMVVAIAALKHGVIKLDSNVFCEGNIEFGDRIFHCWKSKGHGKMNITSAIKESCDVFFYNVAINLGIDKISKVAKDFGLGEIYPIELLNQKKRHYSIKKMEKRKFR